MTKDRKCSACPAMIYRDSKTGLCLKCLHARTRTEAPPVQLAADRDKARYTNEISSLKARYAEALKTIERNEKALGMFGVLDKELSTFTITPRKSGPKSRHEATAVIVASDWHVEENVGKEVGGLNVYNLDIAQERVTKFFQGALRLLKLLQQDVTINTVVLALLGDFISNDIHEEFPEINEQTPMHALVTAQNMLISGIEFLLANSNVKLVIPCHSGNHARTTRTTRFSTENGHSLEYLLYLHLAAYFRTEPRVTFLVSEGMHSYVQVYDTMIRFQHGHAIKYGGGVGGIYIPVNKAISQWDKARHADLNVFGHFHQLRDGGNFLCNGSLIGYNAFALSIKADYEPPKQLLFLLDQKLGRTCTWPILVN